MRLARALMCEANGNGWGRPHLWLLSYGERRRVQQPLPSSTTSRKRSHDNSVSSVSAEGDGDGGADQEPTSGGMLPLSLGADVAA